MTCASCAGIVEGAIKELPGVKEAAVNLATEKARVVYDPALVNPDKIKGAVREAGYDLAIDQITIGIKGMVCASCASVIEESLMRERGWWPNRSTRSYRIRLLGGIMNTFISSPLQLSP